MGIALGLAGLATMFNPLDFDWSDRSALLGNGLILLAALCWAANILYIRAHKWISTPFQLVFWQALLATSISSTLALWIDGAPQVTWSFALAGAFLYAGIFGTALAHWAMVMVNRSLPTVTTSLGLLATPVVGVATSVICLGEPIGTSLICAMAMILGGIAIGTIPRGKGAANRQCPPPVRCAIRTRPHFAGGSARSHGTSSPAENGPSSSVRELRTLAALSPASAGVQGQSPAIPSLTRP